MVYRRSGAQADSLKTIPGDSSTEFLRDGIFGANPSPSRSLDKIVLYKGAPDSSQPVLTMNPVQDNRWNITEEKGFEDSDYGFRKFELVITEEDIN